MIEKRPLTFTLFLLRLLSGVVGGVSGTLAIFVVYFIMLPVIPAGEEVTSISVFAIIIMAFVGTLTANTVTTLMVTFMDNQKYSRRKTTITHIFLFNLVLFFLTIPLYMLAVYINEDIVIGVAALHFLLSAFISALIMEILAGAEYSLLGIYGISLGVFISIGLAFMALATGTSQLVITLGAMPIVWLILQLVGGLVELIYDNFLKYYGIDALNVQTDLGGDKEVEAPTEEDDEDEEEMREED
ncbi:hypothetical protein KJ742_00465 [Patescibacteria group bacterium]|nr:hypothetical protein [Patescibacteria group bacterium]MBU1682397.1 hypothetical protein [Patescibacteria group bacterium]MBU1935427.1 hypothetical protein [Patescibacteria group bacterium]